MYGRGGGFDGGGTDKAKGFGYAGFSLPQRNTGPETQMTQLDLQMATGYAAYGKGYGSTFGKRRVRSEEEYFEDDEDEDPTLSKPPSGDLEYQPAPDSPSAKRDDSDAASVVSDDPLEAFMAGIEDEVTNQDNKTALLTAKKSKDTGKKRKTKGIRDDIDNEDVEESYYRYMEENPMAGVILDDDNMPIEYDADGNAIIPDKNRFIDPLPPIDHSDIDYAKFSKNFYVEHEAITALTKQEVDRLSDNLGIKATGVMADYKPVTSFGHLNFDEALLKAITKANYTQPTPIQAQGIPVALSGRDVVGIAKTGSGKTAAFIWPLLVHIMAQKELSAGEGPIGLICAPTRELAQQIYHEAKKFGKVYNITVVCAYGGGNLYEQCKACEEGAEIIVCTPGRLIDLVKKKATNMRRVTYLVFDEADRMFDLGFEPQVRSIANHVRPDRQTLLFSATFQRRIEKLCRDILRDPIRIVQGDIGEANEDVTQLVTVLPKGNAKWDWLRSRLVRFMSAGSVLIFVTKKLNSIELAERLMKNDFNVGLLHGDMDQTERNKVITAFKRRDMETLIATDVAARGLDIAHIRTVVNYDVARDIDTHTHRIGRTGRAGTKGTAYTLITPRDLEFAAHLVRNLEGASQYVPPELLELALQTTWFEASRFRRQKAQNLNIGGSGLGFRERPGLGSGSSGGSSSGGYSSQQPPTGGAASAGPQGDRISNLRQAFASQFKTSFVSAGMDNTKNIPFTNPNIGDDSAPVTKKKKASRWN